MNDIIVVDDFFGRYQQKEMQLLFTNDDPGWIYKKSADTISQVKAFQANDILVTQYEQFAKIMTSDDQAYWNDVLKQNINKHFNLQVLEIIRSRMIFSLPRVNVDKENYGTPHVDTFIPHFTLIYYVNDSDCKTILFKEFYESSLDFSKKTIETKIKPKQGRAVLFNGLRYHTVEAYNETNRLLLNVNFTV